ncbi:hypothetical protein [Streptomyces griseofuscus]|uniref:nSTAND3 domain-containing NTPase n=1 Tax=Streptomyces griseofuscus TaxID=146922 RepID=UPI003452B1B5
MQCKHWPRATQKKLIGRLIKDELPKVRALAPDRYIVATTVGLTVGGKDELRSAFAPYVRSTGDLCGLDEIVAELLRHPDLVRRHFRLWLSSTAVLQTVLDQDQYLRSSWLQKRLPRAADTFVPHEGFERAKQLLDTQRVCVIASIPGVGKTTVALMLDDFLGRTTLDAPLNKNEGNRLLSVIREIQETPGKALVMTTRDYLLEHTRLRHDRLAALSDAVSVIPLNDLHRRVRGQILYNHVHHSSLPPDDKLRFADPKVWRPVVRRKNFNPRLIEETLRLSARRGQDVAAAMLENLDDPRRVWERIVENELTDEAVHMLEVLLVLVHRAVPPAAPDTVQSFPRTGDRGSGQNALEELRRLAAEPEREPCIAYLELLEELVVFLLRQRAEDELPEEFAVVYGRAERVFALREAERNEWLQKHQIERDPSERSDAARDQALVTDLMRKLDDTR